MRSGGRCRSCATSPTSTVRIESKALKRPAPRLPNATAPLGYLPAAIQSVVRRGPGAMSTRNLLHRECSRPSDLPQVGRSPAPMLRLRQASKASWTLPAPDERRRLSSTPSSASPHLANGCALAAKFHRRTLNALPGRHPGLKQRAENLVDLRDSATFLYARPPDRDRRQGPGPAQSRAGRHPPLGSDDRPVRLSSWNSSRPKAPETGAGLPERKGDQARRRRHPARGLTGRPILAAFSSRLQVLGRQKASPASPTSRATPPDAAFFPAPITLFRRLFQWREQRLNTAWRILQCNSTTLAIMAGNAPYARRTGDHPCASTTSHALQPTASRIRSMMLDRC